MPKRSHSKCSHLVWYFSKTLISVLNHSLHEQKLILKSALVIINKCYTEATVSRWFFLSILLFVFVFLNYLKFWLFIFKQIKTLSVTSIRHHFLYNTPHLKILLSLNDTCTGAISVVVMKGNGEKFVCEWKKRNLKKSQNTQVLTQNSTKC